MNNKKYKIERIKKTSDLNKHMLNDFNKTIIIDSIVLGMSSIADILFIKNSILLHTSSNSREFVINAFLSSVFAGLIINNTADIVETTKRKNEFIDVTYKLIKKEEKYNGN